MPAVFVTTVFLGSKAAGMGTPPRQLKPTANVFNAVANVIEPSFDLFGARLDRFARFLASFLQSLD